jgi:proteasome accessory factor A
MEEGTLPEDVILRDAVIATRQISHEGTGRAVVELEDGRSRDALDLQDAFLVHAQKYLGGRDEETDWILAMWAFTLGALRTAPETLIGGVDWISKRWLLETFRESEGLTWQDPWLQSLDLEYHNVNPEKGLFFALPQEGAIGEFNFRIRKPETMRVPPGDTRASGRGQAVALLQGTSAPYLINWDSISVENGEFLAMPDPFHTYDEEAVALVAAAVTPARIPG